MPKAARIESFQPHMHLRGKAQSLEAILPTGQKVMLSHVANFTFNWHNAYVYADDAAPLLPKGTVLKATSWHDNTAANKSNPDPNVWVGYGDRTVDEMNHIWMNLTYLDEADYLAEVAGPPRQADAAATATTVTKRRRGFVLQGGTSDESPSCADRRRSRPRSGAGSLATSRVSAAHRTAPGAARSRSATAAEADLSGVRRLGRDPGRYAPISWCSGTRTATASQSVEIPIGPNNRIEPGGPDYGQPTVFEPGRQTTVFAIKVPKDFGAKKLTWTLVANGQPAVVTFYLHRDYNLNFYKDEANGNEPPRMKFGAGEPTMTGPTAGFAQTLTGSVGQPVPLKLWVSDSPPLEKNWESIVASRTRPLHMRSRPIRWRSSTAR